MAALAQKIIFPVDQPVTVALASENGVLKKGRYGEYWTYFLEDEGIMFVPPMVAEQIQKLGITTGQNFTITKTDERTARGLTWNVALPGKNQDDEADDIPFSEPAEPVEAKHKKQEAKDDAEPPPHAWPELAEPKPVQSKTNASAPADAHAKVNGSGHANGTVHQNGSGNGLESNGIQPSGVEPTASPLLKACLRAAIDAVIDAETYALSRSYHVRFTSEDVRAAGISVFIAARDGGRR
jgi:hypothetical protein